jgi:hypothetical protein
MVSRECCRINQNVRFYDPSCPRKSRGLTAIQTGRARFPLRPHHRRPDRIRSLYWIIHVHHSLSPSPPTQHLENAYPLVRDILG